MKFVCIECDEVMDFAERQLPGDGTLAAVFICSTCKREVAMLTNPMETQLVSSLGVKIGGREVPEQPMELTRSSVEGGRPDAFRDPEAEHFAGAGQRDDDGAPAQAHTGGHPGGAAGPGRVTWSDEARERLTRVPSFVRGMVKRIYTEYAQEKGIALITPEVMDRARTELGLEGM